MKKADARNMLEDVKISIRLFSLSIFLSLTPRTHLHGKYRGSPDRKILYDFYVWLWDEENRLGLEEKVRVRLTDRNNRFPYRRY